MAVGTDIVGTVGLDIIPITATFHDLLRAQVLPGADKLGDELGAAIARTMAVRIAAAIPKAVSDGSRLAKADAVKQGSSTGGAFADSLRAKLTAAFKAMPRLDVGLNDTGVDAQLARLRAKLEDLRNKRIGVDLSVADAETKLQDLDDRLARLGASSPNVAVRVDVATARAAIADIQAEIRAASASPLDIQVRVGAFESDLIARVEAAQASLPRIEIDANTDPARRQLDGYRAELETVPVRLRVDANFNAAEALAKLATLQAGLKALSEDAHIDVDVRVDAARAAAEIAALTAEVDALSAKRVKLNVDSSSARSSILAIAVALASLVAPVIPVTVAGVGGVAAAFTASAAAVGAFALAAAPALKNVSAAMQAQTAAANQSTSATKNQAAAGTAAALQALTMASAQQALASAERQAAESIRSADEQVANAQRSVAQATEQAADQRKQALPGVVTAEQSLADAQRSEKDAQTALTQARVDAAKQLDDLQDQLADSALDARAAQLQVQHARLTLYSLQENPNANPLDLEDAQLAYDQALQAQKEQAKSAADLKKSAADQQKAGVDGNAAVKSAAEQLAAAQRDVAEKTQAVADAEANVGKVARQTAQAIQDAQRQEADAYRSAADARANAADSIASAERGIESARLSGAKATGAATSANDAYDKALAKLTPSARDLFDAIAGPHGLKTAFTDWSKALQPDVLPIFTRGVNSAKETLPGLTPLVTSGAEAITTLYDAASRELKSPFWVDFKQSIDKTAGPALVGLGKAIGNVFKGGAGIVDAFLDHIGGVDRAMDRITGRFANWGTGLKGSPGFKNFLQYVNREGPRAAQYIGEILSAVTNVAADIQPVTEAFFGPLLHALSWIAVHMPEVVKVFWAWYLISKAQAIAMGVLNAAMAVYDFFAADAAVETSVFAAALASTGISEIILAIEAAVVLLGLALYELWTRAGWFRAGLEDAWKGIKIATLFLWHSVLQPVFDAIGVGLHAVGDAAVWLWQSAISPAFNGIWYAIRILVTAFLTLLVTPVYILITQVLGPVFTWLWNNAIKPAFDGIATAAEFLWKHVLHPVFKAIGDYLRAVYDQILKPVFDGFKLLMRTTGDESTSLWKSSIKPVFEFIGDKASWLWKTALKPQFDLIKYGISQVAKAFGTAKDGIKVAWDQVEKIAKTPVKFVVDHVYNEGILPVWNAVAKITGVNTLDKVDTSKWATGGILPGYTPGQDPHKFYSPTGGRLELSGGESVMRPEWTRAVGAGFVNFMNSAAQRGGVAGVRRAIGGAYSGGGIIDWLGGAAGKAGDVAKGAVGTVKDLASYAVDPTKIWDALTKRVKGLVSGLGSTGWDKMLEKFPLSIVKGLKDKAVSLVTSAFSAKAGGGDSGAHGKGPAAAQAMARSMLAAFGWGGNMMAPLIKLWNQESGWNYQALNPSSGAFGIPQSLPANKMASAGPDWRTNPHTQIVWGLDYISKRYGNPANAWRHEVSNNWYDDGGWLPPGEMLTMNHTGKPEPVFTSGQWDTLKANIDARSSGPSDVHADVRVFVGDREITDIVRTEITTQSAAAAYDLDRGFRL